MSTTTRNRREKASARPRENAGPNRPENRRGNTHAHRGGNARANPHPNARENARRELSPGTLVENLDWQATSRDLWERGYAHTPRVLTDDQCAALTALYDEDARFRSRIDMARYRFGEGEYKYFTRPLPPLVDSLRRDIYPHLVPVANGWMEALGDATRFPATLDGLLAQCVRHGQTRPTPLLLKYHTGDYNCLHQDLYGDVYFPLQAAIFLNEPGVDYTGGEFLLVEQRPRAQSAGEVIVPRRGEMVIFTTRTRPAKGARGSYRVTMKHGVSRVRSGTRMTLGVIFHDAK